MNPRAAQDLESMLDQHGGFVRRLAGSLVFDESRADDVAQETWLATARHPPRDPLTVRGWLARVARNFAFRLRRDDVRRQAREERAARPEVGAAGSPLEGALLREVIDAVLALDEPYRSTVLMRFYENLEPAEIAARLGVPAPTVRTRLRRGLDQIRKRFDDAHAGDRRAWAVTLLPFALGAFEPAAAAAAAAAAGTTAAVALASKPAFASITLGGILMAKKVGVVCGLVAIAVVAVVIAKQSGDPEPDPIGPIRGAGEVAEMPPAPDAPSISPAESAPIEARPYVPTDEDRDVPEIVLAAAGAPSATIVGRVVDRHGSPLGDVPVFLQTRRRTEEDFPSGGDVSDERRLQARTGPDGTFTFSKLPIGIEVNCRARPDTLCDAVRDASVSVPGMLDLGELVAQPGGSVAGVVLGSDGNPLRNCSVTAMPVDGPGRNGGRILGFRHDLHGDGRSATTNASGQYRIDGVAEGECSVAVNSEDHCGDVKAGIKVRTNEVTWEVDFRLSAGAALAGWVRDAGGNPLGGVQVRTTAAELKIGSGAPPSLMAKTARTGADGRFLIRGLPNEPITVRARKPGFIAEVVQRAIPGGDLAFTLRPCGIAWGVVRNAVTGEPIPDFAMQTSAEPFGVGPAKPRVVRGAEAAQAAGVAESPGLFAVLDLPATPVDLHVQAGSFAQAQVGPVRADSGGKTEVQVRLAPQAVVRGVVVDPAGNPVGGATVSIGNATQTEEAGPGGMRFRRKVVARSESDEAGEPQPLARSAVTAPDGSFTISSLPEGAYRLSATHRTYVRSERVEVALRAGETRDDLRLVLEAAGTFAGRAFDADGNPLAGARVRLRTRSAGGDPFSAHGSDPGISDSRGHFEMTGLRPGEYLASLSEHSAGAIEIAFAGEDEGPRQDEAPVTIAAGEIVTKDLRLLPRASLGGLVKEGGKPAEGVRVALTPKGWPDLFGRDSTRTDEDGAFAFEKYAPGDYTLVVQPPGAPVPVRKPVTLVPRGEQRLTIDLPTGAIEGRVTDRTTGKPIAGVTVTAEPVRPDGEATTMTAAIMIRAENDEDLGGGAMISIGEPTEPIRTDPDGRFRLRYLESGRYRVAVRGADVMRHARPNVVVEEGRTTRDVDFGCDKGATLIVSVDPGGRTVADVFGFIELEGDPDSGEAEVGTAKDGIRFTGLRPGRYQVRVEAPMLDLEGQAHADVASGQEARVTVRLRSRE